MRPKKENNLIFYFIASFSAIFVFSFAAFYIFETEVKDVKLEKLKQSEVNLVDFQNQLLKERFRTVLGDINYLQRVYGQDLSTKGRSDEVTRDWMEFSNQRRIYDQIRFIDKDGNEQIRINYENNQAQLVDDAGLQNKEDRYYFFETKILEDKAVYISQLDLNIEGDQIEKPLKPMIRFSTPLYDESSISKAIKLRNPLSQ